MRPKSTHMVTLKLNNRYYLKVLAFKLKKKGFYRQNH